MTELERWNDLEVWRYGILTCQGCSSSHNFSCSATSTGGVGGQGGEGLLSSPVRWHDNTRRGVVWDTLECSIA